MNEIGRRLFAICGGYILQHIQNGKFRMQFFGISAASIDHNDLVQHM
jgi:hypothetical protein